MTNILLSFDVKFRVWLRRKIRVRLDVMHRRCSMENDLSRIHNKNTDSELHLKLTCSLVHMNYA